MLPVISKISMILEHIKVFIFPQFIFYRHPSNKPKSLPCKVENIFYNLFLTQVCFPITLQQTIQFSYHWNCISGFAIWYDILGMGSQINKARDIGLLKILFLKTSLTGSFAKSKLLKILFFFRYVLNFFK